MATIKRFEDIEAWKKSRKLTGDVYRLTKSGPISRDFGLRDQIRRAAVSVMANIAEGFGRKTNKDFAHFLYLSKASAMEVISHLYVVVDQNYIDQHQFNSCRKGYQEIQNMLVKLIIYLERNPKPK